jgi:hypothetical protein
VSSAARHLADLAAALRVEETRLVQQLADLAGANDHARIGGTLAKTRAEIIAIEGLLARYV